MRSDRTGKPIYAVIAEDLKKPIVAGKKKPGDMLPSESELTQRYSASRETVRKGLKVLESSGYIYPVPGKGYYVSKPKFSLFSLAFPEEDGSSDVINIKLISPTEDVAAALALSNKKSVIMVERVLRDSRGPYALDFKYLPYQRGQPTIEEEIKYAVFPEIVAHKVSSFAFHTRMEVSAEAASADTAARLSCWENAPLLVLRRFFIKHDSTPIAYGVRYVLGGRQTLECHSGLDED